MAAPARASSTQESIFQDDILLVYGTDKEVTDTLDTLKALGVDRIRVSVFWGLVAPSATAKQRPSIDAADPAAYPPENWARYDRVVREATTRGIAINLNVTGPAPVWVTGTPDRADLAPTWEPSANEFQRFATAVGIRYNGAYTPPREAPPGPPPPRPGGGLLPLLGAKAAAPQPAAQAAQSSPSPLPRVSFWSVWNEPNHPGWLTPQFVKRGSTQVERSPGVYRGLVDAFFAGMGTSGHGRDTILIGELAPGGSTTKGSTGGTRPLTFLRTLYCLDRGYRRLKGDAASQRACPPSGSAASFASAHPGLFRASGLGHHPYALISPPRAKTANVDNVTVGDLTRLHSALRRVFRAYHQRRKALPVWLTEYGYQTNPPDPAGVSPRVQAAWLNEADYLAYRDPAVRSVSQFLLVDDKPAEGVGTTDPGYWGTFQTGLETVGGAHKAAYDAYRLPLFVPKTSVRRGTALAVWGQVRPAAPGARPRVEIQLRTGGGAFRALRTVSGTAARGFVNARVKLRASGSLRLAWTSPGGDTMLSREVAVRVK